MKNSGGYGWAKNICPAVGKGWYFIQRLSFLVGKLNLSCVQSLAFQIFMQELQWYLLTTSEIERVV